MLLLDSNVLVYAHWTGAPRHAEHRRWFERLLTSSEPVGISEWVLASFLRIVTHPRVFDPPTSMERALEFVTAVRESPNTVLVAPGDGHWEIFIRLCRDAGVRGNHVPDAFLAALAIESGSEWVTTDRGFARFPGLKWRTPLP